MPKQLVLMAAVAVSFFFYHYEFFSFADCVLECREKRRSVVILTFVLNYAWFVAASFLDLHLIVNWTIFFFFFLLQIRIFYHVGFDKSAMLAYFGIIPGLAWNICLRCIFALLLNRPLTSFDNQIKLPGNIKEYPIFLGFVITGFLFYFFRRSQLYERLCIILRDRSSLRFHVGIQFVLYVYLVLNLLGYYVPSNSVFLKFWGIKSAVFVFIGLNICIVYTMRMSRLNLYRRKMREEWTTMLADKEEEERLWTLAYVDALTGCYNRHLAGQVLEKYSAASKDYCLCFVDLDHLKTANDKFGHQEGDRYLKTTASALTAAARDEDYVFRYGGDEFLLLFSEKNCSQVTDLLKDTGEKLKQYSSDKNFPFIMSISFGVAQCSVAETAEELLSLADRRMYEQKRGKDRRKR